MDTYNFNFDLKLLFPAFLKFNLYLFSPHKAKLPFLPDFNLNLKMWLFSIVILMLFLITSITLPIYVRGRIQVGITNHISFFFALTLVGAVFLPEPIFCVGYVVILFISPWHDLLSGFLKRFLFSIWEVLRGIPGVIITFNVENHQQDEGETNPPPPPPPPQVEGVAVDVEMGRNGILPEQPPSEPVTPPPPPVEYVAVNIDMGGNAISPEQLPSEPITAAVVQP
ncbi:hypothetical protein RHSIM_RhsimUnG0140200 [Rhododendron simsii]|uniref:Uncharacterized protein n=1 Tax=Rhododendron simsii TaxID=118357 RepID=A0A834FUK7_RHOSS|nr:hypothetical protein RHSIM_RhsimUnG0140200 [Rhododendron simsii]